MKGDHQPSTVEDMEDKYRQATETDDVIENGKETQSVSSRNESGDSGLVDVQFSPTVPKKVRFEEYESPSENDDRCIKATPSTARFTSAHRGETAPRYRYAPRFLLRRSSVDANRRENAYDSDDGSSEQSLGGDSSRPTPPPTRSGTNTNLPAEPQPPKTGPHPAAGPRINEVNRSIKETTPAKGTPLTPPNAPSGAQPSAKQAEAAPRFTQDEVEGKLEHCRAELQQHKAELLRQIRENCSLRRRLGHTQGQLVRSEEREDELASRLNQEAGNADPSNEEIQLEELMRKNEMLEQEIIDIKAEKLVAQHEKDSLLGDPAEVERLKETMERAAEFSVLEAEWRRRCTSLEQERDVYKDSANELRKQKDEAQIQVEYLVMQNLGEEALELARLEAEATKKLKASEAQNEEMHKEVVRLTRELGEAKMDLDTYKKGGMLSNLWPSAPSGLPSASEVMAENRELKGMVDSLTKDLARAREVQDDFLQTFDRGSLGLGSNGDSDSSRAPSDDGGGDDEGRANLDIIYDRVHDLTVARHDVVERLAHLQHEIDRAVRAKDAAMEKQLRDDERKLSVLAEIQQQTMGEAETLLDEYNEEGEVLDDLESQMLDREAEMAGISRDSDAFRALEQEHSKILDELKLRELRSRRKLEAMDQALDQAGDETYINLKIAQRHVAYLRSHSDSLERDNAELKRTVAENEKQARRQAEEARLLEAHCRELAAQYRGRERELRDCQDELLLCQGEIGETREALDAVMLRLIRIEQKHGPLEEETPNPEDETQNQNQNQNPEDGGGGSRDDDADAPTTATTTTAQEEQQEADGEARVGEVRKATREAVTAEFRGRIAKLEGINKALAKLLGDANYRAGRVTAPEPVSSFQQEYLDIERSVEPRGAERFLALMRRRANILDGQGGALTVGEGQLATKWCEMLREKVRFGHKYRARLWEQQQHTAWDPMVEVDALVRKYERVYHLMPDLPRTGLAGLRLLRAQVALDHLGGDAPETAAAFEALGLRKEDEADEAEQSGDGKRVKPASDSDAAVLRSTPVWKGRVEKLEARRRAWKAGDVPAGKAPLGSCGCRFRRLPCAEHAESDGCACHSHNVTVACEEHKEAFRKRGVAC